MLFKLELCQAILDGRKGQTRRLVREGEFAVHKHIHTVYDRNGRIKWQVSRTYAIQPGRGKKAVGHIRITRIRRERLQEISCGGYVYRSDIQQEGCPFVNDPSQMGLDEVEWFIELWNSINAKKNTHWEDNPEVWVLEFEKVT